jgi:hypothetical protein
MDRLDPGELAAIRHGQALFILKGEDSGKVVCKAGVLNFDSMEFRFPVRLHAILRQGGWRTPKGEDAEAAWKAMANALRVALSPPDHG